MYSDDELLMLSGIQHIAFCERQWALIYIEQLWEENLLTIQGHHLHQRVDDPFESDQKNGIFYLRGVYVVSYELGLYGKADLIEVIAKNKNTPWRGLANLQVNDSITIKPVEYKRGKPKVEPIDEVQLCAQAICIEEMYHINIKEGAIFYGEPRRRFDVIFDENLRTLTKNYALRMHELYNQRETPMPVYKKHCHSCSLFHLCNPKISINPSAKEYLNAMLNFEK